MSQQDWVDKDYSLISRRLEDRRRRADIKKAYRNWRELHPMPTRIPRPRRSSRRSVRPTTSSAIRRAQGIRRVPEAVGSGLPLPR